MKFFVLLGAVLGATWLLSSLVLAMILWNELRSKQDDRSDEQETSPTHEHDCLVHECDFHPDAEVYNKMSSWLARHKLNGIVITDSAVKQCALNLFIDEVRERRPLMGESGDVS